MANRQYSRLARIEEKKNIRSAFIFGILTLLGIILFIAFGLPLVIKVSGILSEIGGSREPVEIFDQTPPPPPILELLPSHTKEAEIQLKGTTEAGSTVKTFVNGIENEVIADSEGSFSKTISLTKRENVVYTVAIDKNGNQSSESRRLTIVYDNEAPTIEMTEPTSTNFYGSKQKNVNIKGKTEPGSKITINDRFVVVGNDGSFSHTVTLSSGANEFNIKAEDQAGNVSEQKLTLNFAS